MVFCMLFGIHKIQSLKFILTSHLLLFFLSCSGQCVYVSSSIGDDNNRGTIESPLRTIEQATQVADTILLKSGDIFYTSLLLKSKSVGKYGGDENPLLCGFKILEKPQWTSMGYNLWRVCLLGSSFSGIVTNESSTSNNICAIYELDKDLLHGRKVRYQTELSRNWDFWQTEKIEDSDKSDYDYLVMYYDGNPNDLKLAFSTYDVAVSMENSTLSDVDIKGYGFGISARTTSIIRDCHLDILGGRLIKSSDGYSCYGNGIEFWVSKDIENCIVENCEISRCYDCGITIQSTGNGKATPRNIIVRNNLIRKCCQGWEDFLRNDPEVVYENCVFENNLVVCSGENGFGYPTSRFKYCHVLGNNYMGDKGMIIRNNIFADGNYYCSGAYQGKYRSNIWKDNICYIKRGDFILGNYMGTKDVVRIPRERGEYRFLQDATEKAIEEYRQLSGDETTRFIVLREKELDKKVKKLIKKYKSKNK